MTSRLAVSKITVRALDLNGCGCEDMRASGVVGLVASITAIVSACGGVTPSASPSPTVKPSEPIPSSVVELVKLPFPVGDPVIGSDIFANTCAVCHGPAANGDPGLAPGLDSPWHAWEHPDRQIQDWIENGKLGLGVNMPSYGDKLDEQAISDVIEYVRTLWTQEQRDVQRDLSLRYEEGYRKYR